MKRAETGQLAALDTTTHNALEISLLGEFAFNFCGHPVAVSAWQRAHAKRLIQLLCSAPKLSESRTRVLEALWPGFDDDRARNRLHHTVHCIRKALNDIPLNFRPQIVVSSDSIDFIPSPNTIIDVQVFTQSLDNDCTLAEERLDALQQALNLFRGELALGWYDCSEIDARRTWLDKKRESALREAIDIAVELNRPTDALTFARRLATLLETDGLAHSHFALLLAQTGRPDAALLHCNEVLANLRSEFPQSAQELENTVLLIQKNANQSVFPIKSTLPLELTKLETAPNLVSRLCVPGPEHALLGYESLVQDCIDQIEDPYCIFVSVLAPPGAGKSLLAATVAYQHQSSMRHGSLWIDCTYIVKPEELLKILARELEPLSGTLANDCDAVCLTLKNKELLVVLDGLKPSAALVKLIQKFGAVNREIRWLVTAWNALHLQGERVLQMESWQLTLASSGGAPSPAAQIIQSYGPTTRRLQDVYSLRLIERIATDLDGLPLSLMIASDLLSSMSPNELWSRLQRDPGMLMRFGADEQSSASARLLAAVQTWFEQSTPAACKMLALLSRFRSWMSRDDIVQLMETEDKNSIDSLIHECVRRQFLLRRSQGQITSPWSEFKVAKIVTAALRINHFPSDTSRHKRQIESWLFARRSSDPKLGGDTASHWFDRHVRDLDAAAQEWIETGELSKLAQLCAVHSAAWSMKRHCNVVLPWLCGLGDAMQTVDTLLAPELLLERARLRVHLSQFDLACQDAGHALTRLVARPDSNLELQAIQLIRRYEISNTSGGRHLPLLAERGIEVGEGLLRIGQLAMRHGQLNQALAVCNQACDVFKFFGLPFGLVKTFHYSAKISFAMGNLELSEQYIDQIEHYAAKLTDLQSARNACQLRANVLLAQMQFDKAIDLLSSEVTKPDYANDHGASARAMAIIAWARYGQGALTTAKELCKTLLESTKVFADVRLRLSLETLTALINARSGQEIAATRSACAAVDLIVCKQLLGDIQIDLVNVAELAVYLQREDLSHPMIHSLKLFAEQPNLKLRPWTAHRMQQVLNLLPVYKELSKKVSQQMTATDVLKELAMSYNAAVIQPPLERAMTFLEADPATPNVHISKTTEVNSDIWKISA